ncbi:MAG: site-2 protease family protein [Gemmatimonadota bacterium]|nr:site-2 protease family protein [Gemmatimonadota bacterium]
MAWSVRIARIAGIPVQVHATFLLLLGWIAWIHWRDGGTLAAVVDGVVFVLAVFLCVVLHEFGHALAARRFGIVTRDITLLPIGGLARLERMPDKPQQELWVAIAGPLVNVAIALVLWAGLTWAGALRPMGSMGVAQGSLLERLLVVNVALVLFNLIPAFPMDGGRVLRALLAFQMGLPRATRVAATLGQGLALLFGLIGLVYNPFLAFIALFVWIGAAQEASAVEVRAILSGVPVRDGMITEFEVLQASAPLSVAVERVLAGSQEDFPVVDGGQVVGVLTRAHLLRTLSHAGTGVPVAAAMLRGVPWVDPDERIEQALERLRASDAPLVLVGEAGRLRGILTETNASELVQIRAALNR